MKAPEKSKKPAAKQEMKPKPVVGKYEVFPEAGFFKYRLKANNGEILVVSNPYRTRESAAQGIDTLKKNVPANNHKVVVDKNGRGQFQIFTGNDSRLVASGEIYPNAAGAESALASLLKFYDTDRIVNLENIPESEHREWKCFPDQITRAANGKISIFTNEEGKYQASLFANNGEKLFTTATYSSKSAAKKGLENIVAKLVTGENMTIAKDKQNRFQFIVYGDNGMVLVLGETYPKRASAESAARSTRNFIQDAKIID